MSYTRADLKEMDKLYKQAKNEGTAAEEDRLPDGRYQAKIKKAELAVSGAGVMNAHFIYEVTGGNEELVGATAHSWEGLRDATNMGYFVKKMKRLKLPFEAFEEVPALLKKAVGAVVELQAKSSKDGEFTNYYVNKLIKAGTGEESSEAEEASEESTEETTEDAPAETIEESGRDAEAADEGAPPREHPTQDEIAELKDAELDKLLAKFGVKSKKLDTKAKRTVAKVLVCGVEDDPDDEFSLAAINAALKAIGAETVEKEKAGWRAIVGYIAELQ